MSNTLTPEDKELIATIKNQVDRLYKAMFPDEQPDNEVEYVECVKKYSGFTVGKVYNFPCPIDDRGAKRDIYPTALSSIYPWEQTFKPSTREAYLAQTTPKEVEQKERWNIEILPFAHNTKDNKI